MERSGEGKTISCGMPHFSSVRRSTCHYNQAIVAHLPLSSDVSSSREQKEPGTWHPKSLFGSDFRKPRNVPQGHEGSEFYGYFPRTGNELPFQQIWLTFNEKRCVREKHFLSRFEEPGRGKQSESTQIRQSYASVMGNQQRWRFITLSKMISPVRWRGHD